MKKAIVIAVALAAVLAGALFLGLQTAPFQRMLGRIAAHYLAKATGETVEVGRVAMPLPLRLTLEHVRIGDTYLEGITYRIGELEIKRARLGGGQGDLEWPSFSLNLDRLAISRLEIGEQALRVVGSIHIDDDFSFALAITPFDRPLSSWVGGSYMVRLRGDHRTEDIFLNVRALPFTYYSEGGAQLRSFHLHLFGKFPIWKAVLNGSGGEGLLLGDFNAIVGGEKGTIAHDLIGDRTDIQGVLSVQPDGTIRVSPISGRGRAAQIEGEIVASVSQGLQSADLTVTLNDLSALSPAAEGTFSAQIQATGNQGSVELTSETILFHSYAFEGLKGRADFDLFDGFKGTGDLSFRLDGNTTTLSATATSPDFKSWTVDADIPVLNLKYVGTEEGHISYDQGLLEITAERFYLSYTEFTGLDISTTMTGESWPFFVSWQTVGEEGHGARLEGSWFWSSDDWWATLDTFQGVIFDEAITLNKALTIRPAGITPLSISAGEGLLELIYAPQDTEEPFFFAADNFPLTIFELPFPRFGVVGTLNGKAWLRDVATGAEGHIDLQFEGVELKDPLLLDVKSLSGHVLGELAGGELTLQTHLDSEAGSPFNAELTFPFLVKGPPLTYEIPDSGSLLGHADFSGELGPILQFLLPDTTKVTGSVDAKLDVAGTAGSPKTHGELNIRNGTLEDFYSGGRLQNMEARFVADGAAISLQSLTATAGEEGTVSASGQIELNPTQDYPFELNFQLGQAHVVDLDLAKARLSGDLQFGGTLAAPKLTGNLTSDRIRINIDQDLPPRVPTLEVTYINVPPSQRERHARQRLVEIGLDVHLTVPRNARIDGKGVKSQWQGEIHASGTLGSPRLDGQLTLMEGTFELAGREATLTQGIVSFDGPPETSTHLDVTGTLDLPDLQVNAVLKGTIPNIELTFYSSPPLTDREILSYVLFGGPTSELTPAQAVQLAQAGVSVAGGDFGPDLLSQFQKGIGLDILTIASPCEDEYGILVGKRFGKNLEVHAYRSINREFNRFRVELQFWRQFYLAGETGDEDGERYSLLWKTDY